MNGNDLDVSAERWRWFPSDDIDVLKRYHGGGRAARDARRPALLVVDVTSPFVGPDAPVMEAQEYSRKACGERAWRAMPSIRALLDAYREAARPVVYVIPEADQRLGAASHALGISVDGRGDLPDDPWDSLEMIRPQGDEFVVRKTRSSGFSGTPLASLLVDNRVDAVIVTGCTTSGCIRSTVLDAYALSFAVTVAEDACFDRSELLHDVALAEMELKYAAVHRSTDIMHDLKGI